MPIRVLDLAKELGLACTEFIDRCRKAGLKVRGQTGTLADHEVRLVRKLFPPPPPEVLAQRQAAEEKKKVAERARAAKRRRVRQEKKKAEAATVEVAAGDAEPAAAAAAAPATTEPVEATAAATEEADAATGTAAGVPLLDLAQIYGIVRHADPAEAEALRRRRRPGGKGKAPVFGRVAPLQPDEELPAPIDLDTSQEEDVVAIPRNWEEEPSFERFRARTEPGEPGGAFEWSGRRGASTRRRPPPRRPVRRKRLAGHSALAEKPRVQGPVELALPLTPRRLSEALGVRTPLIMQKLVAQGQMFGLNDALDEAAAGLLALEFGVELKVLRAADLEQELEAEFARRATDDAAAGAPRAPVVAFLGHVDHGKTSLLDAIRQTHVAAGEAGGITQHIGAYQVEHLGRTITFLDTPGHEAFTAMRARGARATDIVVLVVAADDGVMPQTEEALAHARAAGVPVVVALNKIDLPGIDLHRVQGQLAALELIPEEWGGKTQVAQVSAVTGAGLTSLLEKILLEAEILDLRGHPDRPAGGLCVEAELSEGRGALARLLVRDGTLRRGDVIVCGRTHGTVRLMLDHLGRTVEEARPSMPVEVLGLDGVPEAGEKFHALADLERARSIAETRAARARQAQIDSRRPKRLADLAQMIAEGQKVELNLILKADVKGSLEALREALGNIQSDEVNLSLIHAGVGPVSLSDVLLADAAGAAIVGFEVGVDGGARELAKSKGIEIRIHRIIYELLDQVRGLLEGILPPEEHEVITGHLEVRQLFKISRLGTVAGCYVTDGIVERAGRVRLLRAGQVIHEGHLSSLRHLKDDVREVREGFECGVKIADCDEIQVGDRIEAFHVEQVARKL